jgi:hypothetical protein
MAHFSGITERLSKGSGAVELRMDMVVGDRLREIFTKESGF